MITTEIDSVVPRAQPFICMIATILTTIVRTQKIEITLCVKLRVAIQSIMKANIIDNKIPDTADS